MISKTSYQEKLKELRLALGFKNQTSFAEKLGVTQATIANVESGNREVSKTLLLKIKEVFDIDLLSWSDKKQEQHSSNIVPIPFYSAKAAAGSGETLPDYPEKDVIYFDIRFLQAFVSHNIHNLSLIQAEGDSMSPTIQDGDLLMINDSIKEIFPNKIFVIKQDNKLRVKRLKTELSGETLIISDNPSYPIEVMNKETEIVGQVVWSGNKDYV